MPTTASHIDDVIVKTVYYQYELNVANALHARPLAPNRPAGLQLDQPSTRASFALIAHLEVEHLFSTVHRIAHFVVDGSLVFARTRF